MNSVLIKIINNSRRICQTDCSTDWTQVSAVLQTQSVLKEKFGDNVKLVYQDVSSDETESKKYQEETSFPLLVIEGQVRLAGRFEIRQIVDIIQAHLEIGASR
jgi:disulfide oxidoreductase YuzD